MLTDSMLSIGELSKITQISIRMLRHYDKIGLVKPAYIDPDNKYRYYSDEQILFLSYIKELRDRGFTLNEISEFFSLSDFSAIQEAFLKKIKKIEHEQIELEKSRKRLVDFLEQFEIILNTNKNIDIEQKSFKIKQIPKRKVVFVKNRTLFSPKDFLVRFSELQNVIKKHSLLTKGPYMSIFNDDYLKLKLNEDFTDLEVCIEIRSDELINSNDKNIRTIDKNLFATVMYNDINTIEDTKDACLFLNQIISKSGYDITGPLIKCYFHRKQLKDGSVKAISELQIPISREIE